MPLSTLLVAGPAIALLVLQPQPSPMASAAAGEPLAIAGPNDNRRAAGQMDGDTLVLRLVAGPAGWQADGETGRTWRINAFAEEGEAPSVPGPLLRVRRGTPILATVRNGTTDTLLLRGFATRARVPADTVVLAPGETVERRFVADAEGNYFYGAVARDPRRRMTTSHLRGAFIVDPAGTAPVPPDRILVVTIHTDTVDAEGGLVRAGRALVAGEVISVNGRSWPHTERMRYAQGDSIRWRFINASGAPHTMHLHGFYFRVDAKGTPGRDTIYQPAARRMAVTELVPPGNTMSLVWSPERPGGWIFHCHMTIHVSPRVEVTDMRAGVVQAGSHSRHLRDPDRHSVEGMEGLLVAVTVAPRGRVPDQPEPRRTLRLVAHSDSAPGDRYRRFAYALQRGDAEPPRDSMTVPGPLLLLRRGEPVAIEVVNRMDEPTAVHWHGLEIDSYFDGVVGFGGHPGRLTPAVRPGKSMTIRITPPRAGSFMYHTHFNEIPQQFGGLYGPIVVLDSGERWDPERDHVVMVSDDIGFEKGLINGSSEPPPLKLRAGVPHRLRLMNIAVDRPNTRLELTRGDSATSWRVVAKDGFALDPSRIAERPAVRPLGSGEVVDVEWTPAPGDYRLDFLTGNGIPLARWRIVVR